MNKDLLKLGLVIGGISLAFLIAEKVKEKGKTHKSGTKGVIDDLINDIVSDYEQNNKPKIKKIHYNCFGERIYPFEY